MGSREVTPGPPRAFVVRRSRIAGRGAFAVRRIRKGERLIEYVGERLTHAEADARYDDTAADDHHTFLFSVSRQTVIDAAVSGNDARFINHSCEPNCEAVIERSRVFIEAIRTICPGEELTYDYSLERDGTETEADEVTKYGCRCGSLECRRTLLRPLSRAEKKRRAAAAGRPGRPSRAHAHARSGHKG
ncbi:MAG TPA: SET domain-containing protein-lysine N-methyltransferase [Gemmatimonadaceae bacterium]|nr:SET domain-containing protein-lysine N-methyltransferase [Gemmatimonadaceae bacterium]